jgi:low affinity Fe/Cu permease
VAKNTEHWFSRIATETANGSGRPWAFGIAGGFVAGWLLTGPLFHFSDTWQLVMNTISSIVTFLMVFLIQNAQNRESTALQLKLDELIRVTEARNKLVGIEQLSEAELETLRQEVKKERVTDDRSYAADPTRKSKHKRSKAER